MGIAGMNASKAIVADLRRRAAGRRGG
jgi:hypothetical protein